MRKTARAMTAELVELRELQSSPEQFRCAKYVTRPCRGAIEGATKAHQQKERARRTGPLTNFFFCQFDASAHLRLICRAWRSDASGARPYGSHCCVWMMLRCAACISSGSACFIAVSRRIAIAALDRFLDGAHRAAQLGPARLVDRRCGGQSCGSPSWRKWYWPSLQISLRRYRSRPAGLLLPRRPISQIDADLCSGVLWRMPGRRSRFMLTRRGVAQRTAAAGLRPPPLAGLIEGVLASVNAFRAGEWP